MDLEETKKRINQKQRKDERRYENEVKTRDNEIKRKNAQA